MPWAADVPLLGFEGEYYADDAHYSYTKDRKGVLYIPVPLYGEISVYAWTPSAGEGYNIFYPSCPINPRSAQATDPFMVKMLIQDFLNDIEHFKATGEIRNAHEFQSSDPRSQT